MNTMQPTDACCVVIYSLKTSMKNKLLSLSVMLASLAVGVSGCGENTEPPKAPKVVRSLVVGAAEMDATRVFAGEVHARHETILAFRIGGKISDRMVDAGGIVKAGQTLARLDARDSGLQVLEAESQSSVAEIELKRARDLRAKNFISQSALDVREAAYKASSAQTSLAKNQTGYTTLIADRSGTVAGLYAEVGQVVAAGQPVVRLAPDGEREVAVSLPEGLLGKIKVGDGAEVTFWPDEGKTVKGKVREIAAGADPASRTFAARISLPEADPRLPIGKTASVIFPGKRQSAGPVIPLAALSQQGEQSSVWVIGEDASLTVRPVTVERYTDSGAVIRDGLKDGERIVAAGVYKLVAGEKVRLAQAAPQPAGH